MRHPDFVVQRGNDFLYLGFEFKPTCFFRV